MNNAGPPPNELDAAIAAYLKASKEHREAWNGLERVERDLRHARDRDSEARKALQAARERLNAALDADGVARVP